MTPQEFCDLSREIEEERRESLKPHHLSNLRLYRRIVTRAGKVTPLDEYFLEIVGVPWFGYYAKQKYPTPKGKRKLPPAPEKQESLF